jgi:hypothetical protein
MIPESRHVTFDQAAKPPQEAEPRATVPRPRVNKSEIEPREAVPSPRVNEPTQWMKTIVPIHTVTIDKPIVKSKDSNPIRAEMRERIQKHIGTRSMARIPQRSYPSQITRSIERAQLIHNKETDMYLSYCQILHYPKYKEAWAKSAANEFRQLAQGLKDG